MNHGKVSVLDGGLPRYRVEGHVLDEQSLTSEAEALERAGVNGQVGSHVGKCLNRYGG